MELKGDRKRERMQFFSGLFEGNIPLSFLAQRVFC